MTTTQKISLGAVVLLVMVVALLSSAGKCTPPIAFSCAGVSSSSNTTLVSIGIRNHSRCKIDYFVGTPVLRSNGVGAAFQCPTGTKLVGLGAGRSASAVVTAPPASGEARVPVLWGFTYSPNATKLQQMREDIAAYLRMHDFRGRGALYTNYVTGIKL